jgi:hypothetical protein
MNPRQLSFDILAARWATNKTPLPARVNLSYSILPGDELATNETAPDVEVDL